VTDPTAELQDYTAPKDDFQQTALQKWEGIKGGYLNFLEAEGIPIVRGIGVRNVRDLELKPWARRDARGAYLYLDGMDVLKGVYVLEIPPTKQTAPEKHIYEEFFIVVEGRGTTETWLDKDPEGTRKRFEWQAGSLFRIPPNARYRIVNAARERALFIAANNAPAMLNLFPPDFVFNNDYVFKGFETDREYFKYESRVVAQAYDKRAAVRSNYFPDIVNSELPYDNRRAPGYRRITTMWHGYENVPCGFIGQYPIGRYSMAHAHVAGALIVCLKGEGYTYNWPKEVGMTPWKDGKGDQVRVQEYVEGGLVAAAPGGGFWYHQHFGIGDKPFRICHFWGGPPPRPEVFVNPVTKISLLNTTREGGETVDYRDEDPFIRQEFERRLAAFGRTSDMPAGIYDENGPKFKIVAA
jgi:mannose-6-phosphate isomerase-like protein (cupin superfamily)